MTFNKNDGKAVLSLLALGLIALIAGFLLWHLFLWLFSYDIVVVFFIFAVIITALAFLEMA